MIGYLVEINKVRFEEKEILEVEEIKLGRRRKKWMKKLLIL